MHDIGRTQLEAEHFGAGLGGSGELEQYEAELPLHEGQELEFASRLLEVSNEQELEQFLGDVFRAVGRAAGRFARSDTGRALGTMLKDAVGKALPIVGGALGPAPGGVARGDLAQQAGSLLGLELEGLSRQDQEFETARQLVRFAGSAYRRAASAPRNVPPRTAARMAVAGAGRRYAPGLGRRPERSGPRSDRQRRRDGDRGRSGYRDDGRRRDGYGGGGQAYGRRRGPRPWPPVYRWPAYPWGVAVPPWAAIQEPGGYGPGYGASAPAAGDAPPAGEPPAASEPAAAGEPPEPVQDAAATPAAEPGSAGELGGGFATPSRRPATGGMAAPRARSGRWERRGRVLIVYGV